MMDYKGAIIYISAIIAGSVNEILTSIGLVANIIYIGYQIRSHHKKNKDGNT
jgi:hypothetical protein